MPNNRIIIFSDGDGSKKEIAIRNLLERIGLLNIMMVDLDYIFEQIARSICGDNIIIKGLNVIKKNRYLLPIIFYGGSEEDCDLFVKLCGFDKRNDMGWILNPMNGKRLLDGMKHFKHLKK